MPTPRGAAAAATTPRGAAAAATTPRAGAVPAAASPYGKSPRPTRRRTGAPTGAARPPRKAAAKAAAAAAGQADDQDHHAQLAEIRSQQAEVADKALALDRRLRLLDRMEADSAAQLATSRRIAVEIKSLKTKLAADPPPRGQQRKEMEHSLLTLCKQARALIAVDQPV